jgi:hypothetical protein
MKSTNSYHRKLLAAAVCLLPITAFAADNTSDLSYGYIEADYINLDVDQPGEGNAFDGDWDNGDGFGVSASFPIGEKFFLFGDYSETDSDFSFIDNTNRFIPGNVDIKRLNLGAGIAMPMSERSDLVISGGYADIDFGSFGFGANPDNDSIDDLNEDPSDGFIADVRLRSQWTQAIEGSIGARYTDLEATDGISLVGNVLFELSPNWGINLQVDAGDELITYGAGVRMTF